jgi:hypothetical protein
LNRLAALLCVLLPFAGCVRPTDWETTGYWARLRSAGHVGCNDNEIKVGEIERHAGMGVTTWTAWCRGQVYYCQSRLAGALIDSGERSTACTPVIRQKARAAGAKNPPGCGRDVDCKGDRVCESGQCVSPPAAPPESPVPASPSAEAK